MIAGPTVMLVPYMRQYGEKLFFWINDRQNQRLAGQFLPVPELNFDAWLEHMVRRPFCYFFILVERAPAEPFGYAMLSDVSPIHGHAKLGIAIGSPPHQNRGLGSEAISLLVDFAFADLNLSRVFLDVIDGNARAIRAYEKCGFKHEGRLRRHYYIEGQHRDALLMSVLRSEHRPRPV